MFLQGFAAIALAATLALAVAPVRAQSLNLAFTPTVQSAGALSTLTFVGTLSNLDPTEIFLNGVTVSFSAPDMSVDVTPFFVNSPLSLAPAGSAGDSWTGAHFDVLVGPHPQGGTYSGTFTILGGETNTDSLELVTQDFTITVNAAPEPGSLALIALAAIGLSRRRRG